MPNRPLPRVALLLLALTLTGCGGGGASNRAEAPGSRWAGANTPAARYCAEMGGRLELRAEQAGEAGYCHLPDGTTVEEWKLHQGKNSL